MYKLFFLLYKIKIKIYEKNESTKSIVLINHIIKYKNLFIFKEKITFPTSSKIKENVKLLTFINLCVNKYKILLLGFT